ncbi:hypothetical protein [Parvibaculum sp.]|uniref:hypothetical protein n=1 Tax=Parvibaculum sp. TaxID=2024848 RepID=UPI001DFF1BC8|nr:hypothetical protein [Parvibaculum sp.]MBX3488568.1 hypothetical protein [Parvibaculum sp.]
MALVTTGAGFAVLTAGCLLMQRVDLLGRIVTIAGATLMLIGMLWQSIAMLL